MDITVKKLYKLLFIAISFSSASISPLVQVTFIYYNNNLTIHRIKFNMKLSLVIMALVAVAVAIPNPADPAAPEDVSKRQISGCADCHNGIQSCWNCNPAGGCGNYVQKC